MKTKAVVFLAVGLLSTMILAVTAQDKSVKPGINDSFKNPNPKDFVEKFEVESREVFSKREQIAEACEIKEGQTVADIGAGTGLFTRLFAKKVGDKGKVIAVDIAKNFLDHINKTSQELGLNNVETVLCTADSTELKANIVDLAYICDVYHHFEFPSKTMKSLYQAMKPGAKLYIIDFHRIEGKTSEWTLKHVRAGQEVFEKEIIESGFRKIGEKSELLKDNYFLIFEKPATDTAALDSGNHADHDVLLAQSPGGQGPGRGRGMQKGRGMGKGRSMQKGRGMGPDGNMQADMQIFHYLLENHEKIKRTVQLTDNGVETLTESDDPEVAKRIQEHVSGMKKRIESGQGLRFWDELFAAIFQNYDKIEMKIQKTPKGVKVTESSNLLPVVSLIQAHATVVSKFVKHGFEEAHKNHPVPVPGNDK